MMCKAFLLLLALIALTTAGCPGQDEVEVPDLTGMTAAQASAALGIVGLSLGQVVQAYSGNVPEGIVFGQNPAASSISTPGTGVNILVSAGPFPTDASLDTIKVMLNDGVPLELVRVPSGSFTMGSSATEQDRMQDEGPQRLIAIAQPFYMGQTEVTKRQWMAVMGTSPWAGKQNVSDDPESPAVYVSWNDAQAFIAALNEQTGLKFHLPSEAQWEYAARAGSLSRFYWGADANYHLINIYAWWNGNSMAPTQDFAHSVRRRTPNRWRLYDMSGNGWEMVEDWYHFGYDGAPPDSSPWLTPQTWARVRRGGSWSSPGSFARSAYRSLISPDSGDSSTTFRLVLPEDNS